MKVKAQLLMLVGVVMYTAAVLAGTYVLGFFLKLLIKAFISGYTVLK
jgi:hypothetical protein